MSFHSNEDGIASSPFHATTDGSPAQSGPTDPDEPTSRVSSPNRPLPLPSFVFPMKAPPSSPSPRSAPSSFSRASGRRPMSAVELSGGPTDKTVENEADSGRAKLPDFSFGSQLQSPPLSPRNIPARQGFHKRGTSEFIGGDGKTGNGAGLMSTSPTKGDNVLPSPNPSTLGPSGGRRGHAHRRSAAMSCHDLSMILKPDPTISKGGASAPTSPSAEDHQTSPFPGSLDFAIQPTNKEREPSASVESSPPVKTFNRNRVGFSDFVDIIPRPLSLVSSDSSSTVRQGHSVTGSMSSIVSAGTSSPQSKEKRGLSSLSSQKLVDARPRTAEPFMDRDATRTPDTPRRRNSIPLLMEAAATPTSAPSTPRSAKKWTFFGHESASGESSPKSRPTSAASSDKEPKPGPVETAPSTPDLSTPDTLVRSTEPSNSRRSSLSKKPSKKQKKVRSWAGSILSRKSRQRSQKQKLSRRSPTPPLRAYTPMDEHRGFAFNEPEPELEQPLPSKPEVQTDIASWKPRKLPPQEESMSPIIDLDAALGPFNTPSSFGDDWDSSQRTGIKKRTMHSAAGLGGFSGPGMHYHRRAESAPEFENPRFGLHRLGSSSTMGMEDVFEEDEDEWEDSKASDKESISKGAEEDEDTGLGIDIKVVDSEGMEADKSMDFEEASFQRGVKRKGSGLSEGERRNVSSTKSEHSNRSLMDEPIMEESSPVEIVDDSIPPRSDSGSKSSDSTATPPLRPAAKELAPVDIQPFSLQPPYPTPTSPRSTTQSSFPSPRSPFSYDTQRISTAPSSLTDEQGFQSLLLGEPGPEVRMSVDDVPSLTSSNSTMTRDSGIPMAANNFQFRDGQRSSSLSSAAVSRKRSSMASLSRLISSSHGERSKLSIESRPSTSEGVEKKEKTSRGKRISRMMQFWKPKDS
jgi:hypothetical protein